MMTSFQKSRNLGYHFDLFWKYLWWLRYLPSLKWIGQALLEKTRGVILPPSPPPPHTHTHRSNTTDRNSEVKIRLRASTAERIDEIECLLWENVTRHDTVQTEYIKQQVELLQNENNRLKMESESLLKWIVINSTYKFLWS